MYLYQLDRIERLYNLITSDEKFKELDTKYQSDIILSFFINCFHMKDWLINSGVDKNKVEGFVNNSYELEVCRAIANGTKHLRINHPEKGYQSQKGTYPEVLDWASLGLPSPISRVYDPFEETEYFSIPVDGKEIDCYDFMMHCRDKWIEFLNQEGLQKN